MLTQNRRLSPKLTATFGLVLLILVLNGIAVYRNTMRLHAMHGMVSHTEEVLVQIETVLLNLKEADTEVRGYVISGGDSFLKAYKDAANEVPAQLQRMRQLLADNPAQSRRLDELEQLVSGHLQSLKAITDARTRDGFDAGRDLVVSSSNRTETMRVRNIVNQIRDEEAKLLALRSGEADRSRTAVLIANAVAIGMAILTMATAWYLIDNELEKRRQAELAAQAERQNLMATLTSIGDAVIVTDADTRVRLINSVARELIGNSEPLIGKLLQDIFPVVTASTREAAANSVIRALEMGRVVGTTNDMILLRPDGASVSIEDSAAPIRDESGKITGVILVFRDCTERRRFQDESKERELRFRRMFETPLIGIAVGNSAGYLEEANDAYLDLIGYRRGELDESSMSWGGVPVGQSPLNEVAQLELARSGVCKPFERNYLNARGEAVPVLVSAARLSDLQDRIVVYVTDLTQAKRAEAAFRESESRFRVLSECMPQKVWTARSDGQLDYLNQMFIEYAGRPKEQLTGWGWLELIHPDDLQPQLETWMHSVASGDMFEIEHRLRKSTGEYRWHLARALPIYAPDTQVVTWLGTNTDIHDQKLAEESLREEHRRKDQFLALLAHELRNPLAPLSNAVQVFSNSRFDAAKSADLLAIMQRQVRQMTRLIDDLLDLARITQGRILLRRDRTTAQAVAKMAVEAVQPMIDDRKHRLTVTMPEEDIWLNADSARLSQSLTNLLHNAAKYTDPGGRVELIIEESGKEVLFRVRDNGPGISQEMLKKVFDLFTQAEQTLDRSHGGLGIGLTLVRTLVELHGGSVSAFSEGAGRGSEFVVRLPLPDKPPPRSNAGPVESLELKSLPELRVLVVDDIQASAKTLAMMLRALGQRADAVFDGKSAIRRVTEEHFDVVFLDIAMPGMDGLEVARELRKNSNLDSVTLVALTGFGQEEDRQRSKAAGFNEHLVKPTSLDLLREIIKRVALIADLAPDARCHSATGSDTIG